MSRTLSGVAGFSLAARNVMAPAYGPARTPPSARSIPRGLPPSKARHGRVAPSGRPAYLKVARPKETHACPRLPETGGSETVVERASAGGGRAIHPHAEKLRRSIDAGRDANDPRITPARVENEETADVVARGAELSRDLVRNEAARGKAADRGTARSAFELDARDVVGGDRLDRLGHGRRRRRGGEAARAADLRRACARDSGSSSRRP